jgi:hypothetical protein
MVAPEIALNDSEVFHLTVRPVGIVPPIKSNMTTAAIFELLPITKAGDVMVDTAEAPLSVAPLLSNATPIADYLKRWSR